ncbi:MAG: Swt1 family HEPN domain-containing protein [Candidatus Methanofastidiosia archaeon]
MDKSVIYSRVRRIRRELGYTITREDAAGILAGELGIDIRKYLSEEELERIRNLRVQTKVIEVKSKPTSQTLGFSIKGTKIKVPFLPKRVVHDSSRMVHGYQLFYLLENSIRYFILSQFESKYPFDDWWNKKIPSKIRTNVEKRKQKEQENRWHAKRGEHPIFYTDFKDLRNIILDNWDIFGGLLPDQLWVISRLKDLELSRNIIAHNNSLPREEVKRIELHFRDWMKQIGAA